MVDPSRPHGSVNRLKQESSPYLLQHAHNPVDWYPWGPEAFEAARAQGRPIFLSAGYSTCYWCHVMERQCFENPQIADLMNRLFINIKLDREERPDVDQLYMTAVQLLTRQGGWPMSVWLTPDLKPFYGGTYFPPTDQYGRPGFPRILQAIDDAWHSRRDEVLQSAEQIASGIAQLAEPLSPNVPFTLDGARIAKIVDDALADHDSRLGGFGGAPKFPRQTLLELLLRFSKSGHGSENLRKQSLASALFTLDAMANGGIRDQIGGAFHRYSTDAQWLVPHFEIMLYDNGMLAWCYAEAFRLTGLQHFADVARWIAAFVAGEMTDAGGAFYTAIDAEVDTREGGSYLWTPEEIRELLSADDAELFCRVYGLDRGPNFADPHHGDGTPVSNVLHLPEPIEDAVPDPAERERLSGIRKTLYTARSRRKQPLLDTKIITGWNALMIRGLVHLARATGEQAPLVAAAKAADWLIANHVLPDGTILRTSRDGHGRHAGFLEDYAAMAQCLLDLSEATAMAKWSDAAKSIADQMVARFGDPNRGGFYFSAVGAGDLVIRQKVATDTPLPSGAAMAADVMRRVGRPEIAAECFRAFGEMLRRTGEGASAMATSLLGYLDSNPPITIAPTAAVSPDADAPVSPKATAEQVVAVRPAWDPAGRLLVRLSIGRGYHLHGPAASDGMIATRLSLTQDGSPVSDPHYPPTVTHRFAFASEPLEVYEREIEVVFPPARPLVPGRRLLLSVAYQACDAQSCLPPVTRTIELTSP